MFVHSWDMGRNPSSLPIKGSVTPLSGTLHDTAKFAKPALLIPLQFFFGPNSPSSSTSFSSVLLYPLWFCSIFSELLLIWLMFILVLVILLLLFIMENINNSYNKTIIITITIVISENGYHSMCVVPTFNWLCFVFFLTIWHKYLLFHEYHWCCNILIMSECQIEKRTTMKHLFLANTSATMSTNWA